MNLKWEPYLSLKIPVIVTFAVIWNATLILAFIVMVEFIDARSVRIHPEGMNIIGSLCLFTALFALSPALSKNVRNVLVEPSRSHNFAKKEFIFLAAIASIMAIIMSNPILQTGFDKIFLLR